MCDIRGFFGASLGRSGDYGNRERQLWVLSLGQKRWSLEFEECSSWTRGISTSDTAELAERSLLLVNLAGAFDAFY